MTDISSISNQKDKSIWLPNFETDTTSQ